MIRIGMVGCGLRAWEHARILCDLAGEFQVEFCAFHDVAAPRALLMAQRFGGVSYGSLEKFFESRLDAVWVCVPPRALGKILAAAAPTGVALCLETPLGAHIRTVSALQKALSRANSPVMVSSPFRYGENFDRLKKLLVLKDAPPIAAITASWSAPWPLAAWRRDPKTAGVWLEAGWQILDLVRALGGETRRVFGGAHGSQSRQLWSDATAPDAAHALLELESGLLASVNVVRVGQPFWRLEFVRSDGVFRLENGSLHLERGAHREVFVSAGDELKRQNLAFLGCIGSGKRLGNRTPWVEGLRSQKLALAAQNSLGAGKWRLV